MSAPIRPQPTRKMFLAVCQAVSATVLCLQAVLVRADVVVGNGAQASCTTGALTSAIGAGSGTITFDCGAVPTTILSPAPSGWVIPGGVQMTIDGGNLVTLSGGSVQRILTTGTTTTLTLKNLTLTQAFSASDDGGAVASNGALIVDNCKFSFNHTASSWSGGAILAYGLLTISNSQFIANGGGNGGAIFPRFGASVTSITDTVFDQNVATNATNGWGGAVLLWDGALAHFERTTFTNNQARLAGGAIYIQGASNLVLKDSQFTGNNALDGLGTGGAIYSQGRLDVSGTTFQLNFLSGNGTTYGGAIDVGSGVTTIDSSHFTHNWAWAGGAAFLDTGQLNVTDSWFEGNGYGGNNLVFTQAGGAIQNSGGNASMTNVTLNNNIAGQNGGGFLQGTFNLGAPATTLTNVTVSGNSATGSGGGVWIDGGSTLTNVTIVQNSAGTGGGLQAFGGLTAIRNSVLSGNSGGNCSTTFFGNPNNLSSDGARRRVISHRQDPIV